MYINNITNRQCLTIFTAYSSIRDIKIFCLTHPLYVFAHYNWGRKWRDADYWI